MNWKKLGDSFKSATGVSIAALFVLFATYGDAAVKAATAMPLMLKAFAANLPLGLWSGLLGTALSAGFHAFARSWHKKSLGIEVASILLGMTAVAIQLPDRDPARLMNALIVGVVAGLSGLFLSKIIRAALTGKEDESRPDPSVPKSD
jgi:hypothetical protein